MTLYNKNHKYTSLPFQAFFSTKPLQLQSLKQFSIQEEHQYAFTNNQQHLKITHKYFKNVLLKEYSYFFYRQMFRTLYSQKNFEYKRSGTLIKFMIISDPHQEESLKYIWTNNNIQMNNLLLLFSFLIVSICLRNSAKVKGTDLSLAWEFQGDYIQVELTSKKKSFIPILLSSKMSDSDFWICSKQEHSKSWTVGDYWSIGHSKPNPDKKLNGSDDIQNVNISIDSGEVSCRFRRKLNTGDPYDVILRKNHYMRVCSQDSDTYFLSKHQQMSDVFCFEWPLKEGVHEFEIETSRLKSSPNIKLVHGIGLTIGWGLLIDLGVLFVRYFRTLKYYKLAHTTIFVLVNFSSIPLIVIFIVRQQKSIFYRFGSMNLAKQIHTILGFSTLVLLVLEHILGMISQYLQQSRTKPLCYFKSFQLSHKIVGYLLYVITKIQVINGWWIYKKSKTLVVGIMTVWCTILILFVLQLQTWYRTGKLQNFLDYFGFRRNKVEHKSMLQINENLLNLNDSEHQFPNLVDAIKSKRHRFEIRKLFPKMTYYIFKDMICELRNFSHPGGNSLLEQTIGLDITKYIIGNASLEGNNSILFQHTPYTTTLLQRNCIGRMQTHVILGDPSRWQTQQIIQLSQNIYKITLKNNTFHMSVSPYFYLDYIGKYWLVTINHSRAYTLLLSEIDSNIRYRNSIIKLYDTNFTSSINIHQKIMKTNQITLIIKKYNKGKVSKEIQQKSSFKNIQGLFGMGLDIKKGLNIIITGGTGLLPFLDLFDILLKKAIIFAAQKQEYSNIQKLNIYEMDYSQVYKGSRFMVYASFKNINQFKQFMWISKLHDISQKYQLELFELHLKEIEHPGLFSYKGKIDEKFFKQVLVPLDFSKIHCCGPPKMNEELFQIMKKFGFAEDRFTIM